MRAGRNYAAGEICWTDLQARDVAAARSFYGAVFGWRYEDLAVPGGRSYARAFLDGDPVAGISSQDPQQEASGAPAGWNIYFAADDAQAIVREAPYAGGEVQSGPEAVADAGVRAYLVAPGGGTTGVWEAGTDPGAARSEGPGVLAWAELRTPEPQAAAGFFQQLFGHEVTEYPQDDGGTYTTLRAGGMEVAGIAPLAGEDGTGRAGRDSARWQVYFGVPDVAAAVAAAVAAGAAVLLEPEAAAEGGEEDGGDSEPIAVLQDPQGGVFGLVQA